MRFQRTLARFLCWKETAVGNGSETLPSRVLVLARLAGAALPALSYATVDGHFVSIDGYRTIA